MFKVYINGTFLDEFDEDYNARDYVKDMFEDHINGCWGHMTRREAAEMELDAANALEDLKETYECTFWGDKFEIVECNNNEEE